jgi:hypothetical protein
MDTRRPFLFGALLILLAGGAHAGEFEPNYQTHFDNSDELSRWIQNSGSWSMPDGKFADGQTGPTDIATVEHYDPFNFAWPTMFSDYGIDVYARVRNTGDSSVGVVYNFQDLANYHEASFSASGVATLRSVIDGVTRTDATGRFSAPGIGKWVHISVFHAGGVTRLKIDGRLVLMNLQRGLPNGDAGVMSHNARGQFDDFHVRDFSQVEPYTEDFNDTHANAWGPFSGSWSILQTGPTTTDLSYVSTVVNATSIALSPIPQMWGFSSTMDPFPQPVTFKARMMNPYGGPGNLIGITWLDRSSPQSYVEVVFSPRQARINAVANGIRTTLAEAPYQGGGQNKWFDVEVAFDSDLNGEGGRVKVNGVTVFDPLPRSDLRSAEVGFVTHWAPGRFDDVRASWAVFRGMAATMDDGLLPRELDFFPSRWSVQNGTLNNVDVGSNETAPLNVFHDLADIEFRARIVNHYANAGNLVGLAYGYRAPDDYFEVVFSPTGVAKLNRVLKGVTTNVATASYSGGGQHRSFRVQLIQRQLRTTVKVNGVTVFNEVPQPDAGGAYLGLVAHWAKANFDDIFVTELPAAP